MKSISDSIKSVIIVALVLILGITGAMRLMEIQIVGDEVIVNHSSNSVSPFVYTQNTPATRGDIVDYSGNMIIGNTTSTNIILKKAFFPDDLAEGNKILLLTYNELTKRGLSIEQSLPISASAPYRFTSSDEEELAKLRSDLNLNVYATAENCIDKLVEDYEISEDYSVEEKRIIAGIRYEMAFKDFSYSNDFILAQKADSETVIAMKELGNVLKGVSAADVAVREIVQGNILPHEIGTVGPIYAEEYEELKDEGYQLNDVLGKSGIEAAMESELRGQNGSQEVTVLNNSILNIKTLSEAKAGNTVKLTINSTYQMKLQGILDNFLTNFQSINGNPKLQNVNSGAIVVLDAKTGALRGAATAPTYNLIDYSENYQEISQAENSPLFNRATDGLYRPGSTFKTITATAGLNEGFVDETSLFNCTRKYHYIDTDYQCTGHHNQIPVTKALEVSCNIYFYELSQKLTIDNITKYAELYGLGQHTGLETGDAAGYLANPETFAANNQPWYIGYVLQAGIGNIDCGMTPLQMAVVANTIANEGVRYKPFIVDSLYEYGSNTIISRSQPEIGARIDENYENVFELVEQGMIAASHNMPARYSLSNLGFDVAIKTGTPQNDSRVQDSFFIGYAPADNPIIAFAGVIEGGEYSKYMIRDIILSYMECYGWQESAPSVTLGGLTAPTQPEDPTGTNEGEDTTEAPTEIMTEDTTSAVTETPTDAAAEENTTEPPAATEAPTASAEPATSEPPTAEAAQ